MEKNHSKKYRLIHEYPGSPKLGYILEPIHNNKQEYYINHIFIAPENHPEFWQEIVEKDYEILSFIVNSNESILTKRQNGLFESTAFKGTKGAYSEEDILSNDPKRVDWDNKGSKYGYSIHSIKRLSDGEIFTVGDKVHLNNGNYYTSILKEIKYVSNDEKGHLEKYRNGTFLKLGIQNSNMESPSFFYLEDCVKTKIKLFTTEDGVDIFEGDTVYYIHVETVYTYSPIIVSDVFKKQKGYVYFHSKEKHDQYVAFHKAKFSKQDIFNIIHKGFDKKSASSLGKHKILAMFGIGPLPSEKQKLFTIEEIEAKLENYFKTWDSTTLIDKQVLLNLLKQ